MGTFWSGDIPHHATHGRTRSKTGVRQERERKKRIAKEVGETATRDEKLKDIDEILDEIDEVLEENAETFVSSYIQKGGQ